MPVYIEGSNIPFPTDHDQMIGFHSIRNPNQKAILAESDLILSIGADLFQDWFYEGDILLSQKNKLVQLDSKPSTQGNRQPAIFYGLASLFSGQMRPFGWRDRPNLRKDLFCCILPLW